MIGRRAGVVGLVSELVCVDPCGSESFQPLSDGALPAPAASRQADHVRELGESGARLVWARQHGILLVLYVKLLDVEKGINDFSVLDA